jgi:hypothetical protein
VFIRQADISRVLDAAEKIVAKEKLMAESIRAGTPIGQVMGADYESMLKGELTNGNERKSSVQAGYHGTE